jgi:hypothetical protein
LPPRAGIIKKINSYKDYFDSTDKKNENKDKNKTKPAY